MRAQEPLSVFYRPEPAPVAFISSMAPHRRLTISRALAAVSAAVLVAVIAVDLVSPAPEKSSVAAEPPARSPWIEVARANGAFELSSPLVAGLDQTYLTRRHRSGEGRHDILTFGAAASTTQAFVRIAIYRPGNDGAVPIDAMEAVASVAADSRIDAELRDAGANVITKFGELATVEMQLLNGNTPRNCLAAAGKFDEPGLGIVVWYCNPGAELVAVGQVACLLDRLSLASSGRDEKLIEFFAKAELNRSFCDARNTLYGNAPRAPDWIDTKAGPVLRGKFSAR